MLDASAALELLLGTPLAAAVSSRVFAPTESMHAPHLIDVEVAHVLRRLRRRGEIEEPRARQALDDLADLAIARHSHEMLLPAIWAVRDNASAHDAAYVALTDALDATLITCDAALATLPGENRRVEVIR